MKKVHIATMQASLKRQWRISGMRLFKKKEKKKQASFVLSAADYLVSLKV